MAAGVTTRPEDVTSLVDVGLYTPFDAARYLRVPMWFFLLLTDRNWDWPSGGWWSVNVVWPLEDPMLDDDVASRLDDPSLTRLSFRRLVTLFVRAASYDLLTESPRAGEGREEIFQGVRSGLGATTRPAVESGALPHHELAVQLAGSFARLPDGARERLHHHFIRRLSAIEIVDGEPARIYPPTRDQSDESPRLVVIDPRVRFGRPTVARTGTPTDVLFERYRAGDSVATLAVDYDLTTDEVEETIRYEVMPRIVLSRKPLR